ncbi:MAG: hypothetical protein MI919_14175, partial [Holophagales bacterium]|nr:hypothetical protein [Holophagales bacterium]
MPPALFTITETSPTKSATGLNPAGTVDEALIALDTGLVDRVPDALELPLADGRRLRAERTFFEVTESYLSWAGQVKGQHGETGYIHLVDHGDRVSAVLNVGTEHFQIVGDEAGQRLVEIELAHGVCGLDDPAIRQAFELHGGGDPLDLAEAAPPLPAFESASEPEAADAGPS